MRIQVSLGAGPNISYVVPEAFEGMSFRSFEIDLTAGAVFVERPNLSITGSDGNTVQFASPDDPLGVGLVGNYMFGDYGTYRFNTAFNDFWIPMPPVILEADDIIELVTVDSTFQSALLVIS